MNAPCPTCQTCKDTGFALVVRWVPRKNAKKEPFKVRRLRFQKCPYCAHAGDPPIADEERRTDFAG